MNDSVEYIVSCSTHETFEDKFKTFLCNPLYEFSSEDLKIFIQSPTTLYYKYSSESFDYKDYIPATDLSSLDLDKKVALVKFVEFLDLNVTSESDISYNFLYSLDKEDKKVIASIITWLPSNVGMSFLRDAFIKYKNLDRKDAFLLSWTKINSRSIGTNNSYRLLEYIITPSECKDFHRGLVNFLPKDISCLVYEIAEHFVSWLSTTAGQLYLITAIPKTKDFII